MVGLMEGLMEDRRGCEFDSIDSVLERLDFAVGFESAGFE